MNVQSALLATIPDCDQIAREWESAVKGSLGWVRRDNMTAAISKGMMNTVILEGYVRGFVIWSTPTRGANKGWHVIHTLAVDVACQKQGIGRALLNSVPLPVRLKCPVMAGKYPHPNPANDFYKACGFALAGTGATKGGKLLNVWEKLS